MPWPGTTSSYTYTSAGFRGTATDPRGNTTIFCYDTDYTGAAIAGSLGNLTRTISPPPTTGANPLVSLVKYDAKNNVVETVAPKGVSNGASVNCSTNLSGAVNSSGLYLTDLAYDTTLGTELLSVTRKYTDPDLGAQTAVTKFEYGDSANPGLVTRIIPPRGNTGSSPDYTYATSMTYGASGIQAGMLASVTDPLSNKTTYTYDAVGRRTSLVDPNGNASGANPADHTWSFVYDNEDRLTQATAPAPASGGTALTTGASFDPVGNRLTLTDANGQITRYLYDVRDSLAEVDQSATATDPNNDPSKIRTVYSYDALGNLNRVDRAVGAASEEVVDYAYDGLNRVRKETQYPQAGWPSAPNGSTTSQTLLTQTTYDPNSNRLTLTDPLNQLTTFGYDAVNRLTGITYTNPAPGTSATANVSYVYDANGNRLSMGDGTGSTTYVYDELDRLLSVTSLNTGTVGYRFDLDGNRTKLIYPDNTAVTYSFNKASQLQSLLDWASRTTSYSYFADGLLNITTNPNGTSAQFSYDNARRLTDVWNQEGTSTISRHTYTLDAVGNRTQLTEVLPQLGAPGPSAGMPLEMANAGGPPVADQLPSAGAVDPGDTMLSAASVASGPLAQAPPPASGPSTTPTSVPSATSTKVTTTPTAVVPASTRTTATPPPTLTATPSASAAGAAATPTSSKPTAARDVQNGPPPDLLDLSRPLTLTRRPNGDQLQVLLRPSGFQVVPIDAATYSLRDSHGTEQLRLRAAAILDGLGATGQTSVTVSSDQKTATLHFDPAFLAGATYPLTISPVVIRAQPGHPTPVANAAADQATGGEDELAIASVSNANGWGANWYGEVGDGTSTQRSTPNSVVNLTNQVAISAGGYHSLALSNDGRVWTWGANWDGELGRATTTTCWDGSQNAPCDPNPQSIPSFNGVVAIAGGGYHSLALKNDGTVWAWGGNWDGELGDGTTTNQSIPVQVQGLSGVTAIAAGRYFSLALKSDGTVWAWGDNESGQLGNGTNTNSLTPVQVQSLADVTQLKAGAYFGLALDGTGGLWSWGDNAYGQLGLGSNGNGVNLPSHITTLSSVVLLSAGGYHGLAEKSDGTLWSWGADWDGELAYTASQTCVYNGSNNPCSMTPAQVPGLSGLSQLAGADWHSLALKDDGTVWAWGGNWQGELGDGTTTGSTTPVQSTGLTGQTLVAAGREHSLSGVADRVATTTYTYDKLYRLTGVANPADTTTYSYDPLGNRTSKVLGSSTTNYSYDRSDRITAASSTSYTVNANGNETARGSDNFTYDQANRLTSATVGGATSTYVYDGDGKRVSKTVGGITTRYVYDVGGGLPVVLDDGTNKYVWGAGGLATAVNKTSGAASVYHTDGLGSVRALTDNSGSVVQTYQTDEFGIPTQSQGGVSQSFGYTGEPRDSEDGLQYLRARTYDSGIGRFLQRDRRYGTLKDSQSLNGYSYVRNNPLRFTDRTGLTPSESGDACPDCVSEVGLLNGSPLDYAFLIVSAVVPGGPGDDIVVADAADAAEGAVTSLAKWEPDFAAKQILGGSNITAGGRTITWHAADRIVTSGRGIAVADIDPILDNAIRLTYNPLARGGATIRLFDVLGRSVVVDAETGLRIVTVIP